MVEYDPFEMLVRLYLEPEQKGRGSLKDTNRG